jgi:hypothetical protein
MVSPYPVAETKQWEQWRFQRSVICDVAQGCTNGAVDRCGGGYGNHVVVRFRGQLPGDTTDLSRYIELDHLDQAARRYSWSRPPRRSRRSTWLPRVTIGSAGGQGTRCSRPWCGQAWW